MPLAAALRTRAEQRLAQQPPAASFDSPADPIRLVHELQVHQLELEMQNAHLQHLQSELEQARDRYIDLFDYAPVGYLSLDCKGTIVDANLTASLMLKIEHGKLPTQIFARFISPEDCNRWHGSRRNVHLATHRDTCRLQLAPDDGSTLFVRMHLTRISTDSHAPLRAALVDISEAEYRGK